MTSPRLDAMAPQIALAPEAVPAPALLRPFRHRNYRIFVGGQIVSLLGTWMQQIAQAWLVYRLTHSTFLLGLTTFCGTGAIFFIAPFGGMIADRIDRRRMLVFTQCVSFLQAAALAMLALTGLIQVWHIILLSLLLGLVDGVDIPTRNAMTLDMVAQEDLRGAIALNSITFNLARILGPTIATAIIALAGEGVCFALNAVSFGGSLTSLYLMRIPARPSRLVMHPLREIWEGYRYSLSSPVIRSGLFLVGVTSMFGASYFTLLPAMAHDVLHGSTVTYGVLTATTGIGALMGAYLLSHLPERWMAALPVVAAVTAGACLIAFSLSRYLWLSALLLLPATAGLMLVIGATNTMLQTAAAPEFRGRVISHYAQCFMGMTPWGALLFGALAGVLGVAPCILLGATVVIGAGLLVHTPRWHEIGCPPAAEADIGPTSTY